MKIVKQIWNNFKIQPDIWFFYGFLITSVLSVRKVLFFYPLGGQFNEYGGTYIYLSDVLLILTLLGWVYSMFYNKNTFLSSVAIPTFSPTPNIPQEPAKKFDRNLWNIFLPLFIFIIWVVVGLLWAPFKNLEVFKIAKFGLFGLFFCYVVTQVPRGTFFRNTLRILVFLGLFEAILGISQFILQHSVGIFWLKESFIKPNIPGVAKIVLAGKKFIRAYGTFPHPNVLGGFLFHAIVIAIFYKKMFHEKMDVPQKINQANLFHVEQISQNQRPRTSTQNSAESVPQPASGAKVENMFHVEHSLFGFKWPFLKTLRFLIILLLSLFLTFSKSAWLALAISWLYINYRLDLRGTINKTMADKLFHVKQFVVRNLNGKNLLRLVLASLIIVSLWFTLRPDMESLITRSVQDRLFYLDVSRGTIEDNFWLGTGAGQSVMLADKYAEGPLESWQYQPVHNVFLLIWAELGIIGLGLFIWWLSQLFNFNAARFVPRGTSNMESEERIELSWSRIIVFQGILLGLLIIMLFDHYPWDIQQGQVMFWLVAGLLAGVSLNNSIDK